MEKKGSLLDMVPKGEIFTARKIVEMHEEEISQLLNQGKFLKDIHKLLLELYKEEIEAPDSQINFSEAHFYKLYKTISN